MGLQKVSLTRGTVELAPRATTGMTVGTQIAQAEPPPVITTGMRTEVLRGVHLTGSPVRRDHGVGRYRRRRFGRRCVSFTQGAMRLLGEPLKGFGLVRVGPLGLEGLWLDGCGWCTHRAFGPGEVQHDEEPDEGEQDELIEKKR